MDAALSAALVNRDLRIFTIAAVLPGCWTAAAERTGDSRIDSFTTAAGVTNRIENL
jgi:hypothetical protein